ncbi:hypothetical protein FFLO_04514 [Filobasidium floriforme]|uniref:Beta-galactosidase n=2 Tax=Filobasidium floriforme TaxID=5210 RepID=A0A8K0JIP0_9TREE|nr:hypothetical protein FFLO_04514 [Filobasidium floriforme]
MSDKWAPLQAAGINTILGAVCWDQIEQTEGQFDFEHLDGIIEQARDRKMHLILLWFGSFKNGQSSYVPTWVKKDHRRFPRAFIRDSTSGKLKMTEVLSVFDRSNVEADKTAFVRLMRHIRDIDSAHGTVLMVQVENEVGLLGSSRDHGSSADKAFKQAPPSEMVDRLRSDRDNLNPTLLSSLHHFLSLPATARPANWSETFGTSLKADEVFMAYHYARYVNEIAAAGKEAYQLPMFVNVWLSSIDMDRDIQLPTFMTAGGGGHPGFYPSGGPVIDVLDIWQLFAPSIDFVAPDIYLQVYAKILAHYRHRNQPLMIPEQRRDEHGLRRLWEAYGSHGALYASPFGIDTFPDAERDLLVEHFGLLSKVRKYLLDIQADPKRGFGFCFDEPKDGETFNSAPKHIEMGSWRLTVTRGFSFGDVRPGYGIIYQLSEDRFLLVGGGFSVGFESTKSTSLFSGIARLSEVDISDPSTGELVVNRWMNGDETGSGTSARMPNSQLPPMTVPIPIDTPAVTRLAVCEVYSLEE